MRTLPSETKGGKLGKRIRGAVGDTTDSILVVFYMALFLFLIINRRASMFLMLFTRVAKNLEYIVYRQEYGR